MARPLKVGIDYFPTDVDIDQDDKVVMVKNKYGLIGMGTVMMLLARVYKTGYYYNWTEREQELFAGHFGAEVNVINNIVNECIKWGFFDRNKLEQHNVLTSKGIQKRYLLAVERRKDKGIIEEYWLIEGVNVNNNSVNEDNKPVNASKSTQSKVKESKVKEVKDIPHRDLFEKFYETYPKREGRVDAELAWANMLKRKCDPNEVITAAYNYMVKTSADGTEKKFMKLPSTFINKDRWKEFLIPIITDIRTSIHTSPKEYVPTPEDDARMERYRRAMENV